MLSKAIQKQLNGIEKEPSKGLSKPSKAHSGKLSKRSFMSAKEQNP